MYRLRRERLERSKGDCARRIDKVWYSCAVHGLLVVNVRAGMKRRRRESRRPEELF